MNNVVSVLCRISEFFFRKKINVIFSIILLFSSRFISVVHGVNGESRNNKIIDFYATGSNGSDFIYADPYNVTLIYNDNKISFIPFNSLRWEKVGVDTIFILNITSNNFYIGYLYLYHDSNERLGLWLYEYNTGKLSYIHFDGVHNIGTDKVSVNSTIKEELDIIPEPKTLNRIYVVGDNINITGNTGKLNGYNVYALYNLYNVTGLWNELWILLVDEFKNYYYGIIHTYNNDENIISLSYLTKLTNNIEIYGESEKVGKWYLVSEESIPYFNISCIASDRSVNVGEIQTISGLITPKVVDAKIVLQFTNPKIEQITKTVLTDSKGIYSYEFKPDINGDWSVYAQWEGNLSYRSSYSDFEKFIVNEAPGFPTKVLQLGKIIVILFLGVQLCMHVFAKKSPLKDKNTWFPPMNSKM